MSQLLPIKENFLLKIIKLSSTFIYILVQPSYTLTPLNKDKDFAKALAFTM